MGSLLILGILTANSISAIAADMTEPGEGMPAGVPESYDWAAKGRVGMGNRPGEWRAFIPWGQLYVARGGNPAANTLVEIRGLKGYILSRRTGKWSLVSTSNPGGIAGAQYAENFKDDVNRPAGAVPLGHGVVVSAGEGYNYHFWPQSGRVEIRPDDIAGVFTTVEARLVLRDPKGPDDREKARYLLSVGGDWWKSLDAKWDQLQTNGDVGIGRFKWVRKEWRAYNMTSLTKAELEKNPPPLR